MKKVSIVLTEIFRQLKERILEEADKLFTQYGVKSITMDDISKKLGISKKTIYQFFENKDDVVEQWTLFVIGHIEEGMNSSSANAENAVQEVFNYMENAQEMMSKMNPLIFHDIYKYHPKAYQVFKAHKDQKELGMIKKMIAWGIKDGLFREDLNIEILSRFKSATADICFTMADQSNTFADIIKSMHELTLNFLYGLSTLKGHTVIDHYREVSRERLNLNAA